MDKTRYSPAPQDAVTLDMSHDRNEDRDANIFALGDAAANLDEDIDDLFSGFGLNLSDIVKDGATSKITTKRFKVPEQTFVDTKKPADDTVQVSTISQQFANGRSIQTKLIKGPVTCKKRVVQISRETPDGFELLAEVEAPGDVDVNRLLATAIPESLGISTASSLEADYDNLDPGYADVFKHDQSGFREDDWVGLKEDVERVRRQNGQPNVERHMNSTDRVENTTTQMSPKPIFKPKSHSDPLHDQLQSRQFETVPLMDISDSSETENQINQAKLLEDKKSTTICDGHVPSGQNGDVHNKLSRKRSRISKRRGSHNDSTRRKSVSHLADEESIQLYEPPGNDDDDSSDTDTGRCCVACKKGKSKKKVNLKNKSFAEVAKKKAGMTAMHPDIDHGVLPGIKALVANYAKMLYEDRMQFVDTMFRAVKLNNVDVTRILCKIVQKSGFKLSQFDLREPESSATILHVALLYNHEHIVRMLLALHDRDLIVAKYESYEYRNQTGLHLAVANENPALIEEIVSSLEPHDRVALINTIANGQYFKTQHPDGQLCLTAAAWAGNYLVIKTLVRYGAELGLKNASGYTLLHSVIMQSVQFPDRSHYERLVECIWESCSIKAEQLTILYDTKFQKQKELKQDELRENMFRELLKIRNNDGYTALALAATKTSRLFKYLINMERIFKIPQNKLGSIAWVTYDITDISSFATTKYNKFSVLHILAHNNQQLSRRNQMENEIEEDFLEMEPVSTIITNKWNTVYRWVYIAWMIIHLSYMVVFTACTVQTNSKPLVKPNEDPKIVDPQLWLAFFMILPSIYMMQECLDIGGIKPYRIQFMANQNYVRRCMNCLKSEWTITGNGPYRLVNFGFSSFTLQWFILYLQKDDKQDVALSMSLLLGWIFVLFFTRACRVTCRFTIMIQKMFFRDLIYFLTVYGIILIAFSFSMNALFAYLGKPDSMISKVFNDMMNVVTDLDTKQSNEGSRHYMFSKLLLILYAIVAVILLMNMLIAMMNTSYETVRASRCNLWKQQQLSIMLMMERRFFFLKYICKKSEGDTWTKDIGENKEKRCFLDVTMLNKPGEQKTKEEQNTELPVTMGVQTTDV